MHAIVMEFSDSPDELEAGISHVHDEVVPALAGDESAQRWWLVDRQSGHHALMALRRSRGRAVAVDDAALRRAEESLRRSGICVEPSSAASLAGVRSLVTEGERLTGETIVLIATGTGLRWPATFDGISSTPPIVAASLSALSREVSL